MNSNRIFLWVLGLIFVVLQAYALFAPEIGVVDLHGGFMEGLKLYYPSHLNDGLLLAGLIDFIAIELIALVWMVFDLPAEKKWNLKFFVWLPIYLVYPGLGFLLYFLWLHKEHRFVSG